MALRFLSDAQREQLSGFPPEVDAEVLDRFFTLSGADLSEVRRRQAAASMRSAKADVLAFTPFPFDRWQKVWSNNPRSSG